MPTTNEPVIADRQIRATRLFDAPRELVWKVWTTPEHIHQWWGPTGFTTTTEKMEVKPGGVWQFCMHGPDGRDYGNKITYIDVVEPQRLEYKQGGDENFKPADFHVIVTFENIGGKTEVTMEMTFVSNADRDHVINEYGAVEGMKQTLSRLGEHLADGATAFYISRTFDAPRELVFKAWTERDRLMQWFGPKGMKMTAANMDQRPGGTFHYRLQAANGLEIWGKFIYREITPPLRIVWVGTFSDAQGGLSRHPLAPEWPQQMLTSATFTEHKGRTTVVLRSEAIEATPEEKKMFDTNHASMTGGWGGTFEQLADYLATARA